MDLHCGMRKWLLVLAIGSVPVLMACMEGSTPAPAAEPSGQQLKEKSPLAKLMRHITAHADSVRATLKRGDGLPPYPQIDELLTAASTDSLMDRQTYSVFAADYRKKLDGLYAAAPADRTQAYNTLVQSCATCHSTMCPGPLVLIKKMYAPVPERIP